MANCNYRYPRQTAMLCADIINAVTGISELPSIVDMEALHASMVAKFDSIIKRCRVDSMPAEAATELIYPLAALVDETLLSNPKYRYYWTERPLQLRYFGEVIAGTKFFAKLEAHIRQNEPCVEILEAYFVSLALGLKGMYGGDEARRCAGVTESLGVTLMDIRSKRPGAAAVDKTEKHDRRYGRAAFIAFLSATTVASMIAAVVFRWVSLTGLIEFLGGF